MTSWYLSFKVHLTTDFRLYLEGFTMLFRTCRVINIYLEAELNSELLFPISRRIDLISLIKCMFDLCLALFIGENNIKVKYNMFETENKRCCLRVSLSIVFWGRTTISYSNIILNIIIILKTVVFLNI